MTTARVLPVVVALAVFAACFSAGATGSLRSRGVHQPHDPSRVLRAVAQHWASARAARRLLDSLVDDGPDVVDLLAVAATSGCNVRLAVEAVATRHEGPSADVFARSIAATDRGERLADALAALPGSLPSAGADALRPIVATLVESERYGTPLAPALERLGTDLRLHRQRRAEERARRAPVRMLLPLVACVLPAFALLTVVPLLAGIASGALADLPSPSVPLDNPKDLP